MSLAATSKSAARGKRALTLTAAVLIAGCAVLMGGVGGASATALATCSTTISAPVATPSTVPAGTPVMYSATVTASAGCTNGSPSGTVSFFSNYIVGGLPQAFQIGSPVSVTPSGTAGQSTATLTDSSLPAGSFAITAAFSSSNTAAFLNSPTSSGTTVVISNSGTSTTSMQLSASATTITVGQPITFNVHVNVLDLNGNVTNSVAAGNVDFSAGSAGGVGQVHFASAELDGTGSLSYSYLGFLPGDYLIIASYLGSPVDSPTSGQLLLHVLPAQTATPTTTAVTASPSSFPNGTSTTLTANVTQTASGTPVPAGDNVTFYAGPTTTSLTAEGQAQTDANGNAQVTVQNFIPGSYVVIAQFNGDGANNLGSSTGQTTIVVSTPGGTGTAATQLAYTGATSSAFGGSATLSAQLEDAFGGAIGDEQVTLSLGSQSCSGTTDQHGNVSCAITVTQDPGPYTVTGSFNGDSHWAPASASSPFTVGLAQTALAYNGDTSGTVGATATLAATLTSGGPLANKTVSLAMGSQSCSGTTDGAGHVSCTITISQPAGGYPVTATFAGDKDYAGSNASSTFTVSAPAAPTVTTYTGDTQDLSSATATLSAKVAPAPDGGTVTFTLGSQSCSAPAAGGTASCTIALSQAPGGYTVNVAYSGDAAFQASSTSSPFTIVAPTTTTHIAAISPVLAGASTTLSATVSPSTAPGTVTFSTGSTTLCTATLSGGAASCPASFAQTGTYTVTAKYAGSGLYPASSDSTTALVYALAPGGGSFVVGDKSDTGSVTFWGSQWSKLNSLSGGVSPDAFKGFALNPSAPSCGTTWSTDPGNSAPPPVGPLPAYMAVIVTSNSGKAGNMIFGNTVAIVIVQTNAGYKNDPGHAGTGTVVATLCTGSGTLTPPTTTTTYTGPTSGAVGSQEKLTATLTDASGNGINGETVTISLGSQSCSAKSDGHGNVNCNVTLNQPAGTYPVTATFAGDGSYGGSSGSGSFTVTPIPFCQTKGTKCESLLADPVASGRSLSIVYMDDSSISTTSTPTAVLSNGQSLPVTVTTTSGQPQHYVDSNGGSASTKSQSLLSFTVPASVPSGTYTVTVTVYDGDGDSDQYVWSITI